MRAAAREVRFAPDRAVARAAVAVLAVLAVKYGAEHPEAVERLAADRDALPTFLGFPTEHRDHPRTADPIESVLATLRRRIVCTEGAPSRTTARPMIFERVMAASRARPRPRG